MAVAASAATLLAEWLVTGVGVTTLTSTEGEAKVLLADSVPLLGEISVTCTAKFDGSVGANGEDEITEVLNASAVAVTLTKPLIPPECKTQKTCEEASIKVSPELLPWHTNLALEEASGLFIDQATSEAGYNVICKAFGLTEEDECIAAVGSSGKVSNGATDVLLEGELSPRATCTFTKEKSGIVVFESGLTATLTGTLTVSE